MKASSILGEATTPDGTRLVLVEHDGSYCIRCNGGTLMHSQVSTSEERLGEVACDGHRGGTAPRILIGGLGLGFTLKVVLERAGADAQIDVAELIPEVIAWNRGFLRDLNGQLLDDARVVVYAEDVIVTLRRAGAGAYDAIVLDVDNGPAALVSSTNSGLYDRTGIRTLARALKAGGRLVIWSAQQDARFKKNLSAAGLAVEVIAAKLYPNARRAAGVIYLAGRQT